MQASPVGAGSAPASLYAKMCANSRMGVSMSGVYELLDPEATYSQGQSIASSEADARAAGDALVNSLSEITPGSDHDAGLLKSAIHTFQTDCADARNTYAHEVSALGENTASGAQTGVQTNSDGTQVARTNTSLARSVNDQICRIPQY